eukprot:TRINITY_DN67666_c0_g1_i1.p1 TRINITY_DN67666_c0_g1~~TRINITY_DN67666_c0_g1_i1.p1  ORF type:complete len:232 (-),score=27.78 TRINITY_DN67666_c0_g1_i1:39-734(-)
MSAVTDLLHLELFGMPLKDLIVKSLGAAMMLGALGMKLPQVLKIVKARSVFGISEAWVINDFIGGSLYAVYNMLVGHPFISWAENLIIAVQNAIIVALFWMYSPSLSKPPRLIASGVFFALVLLAFVFGLPPALLSSLGVLTMVIANVSKVPQIVKNYGQKHTGTMSPIPIVLASGGTAVRVLTGFLQTPDDILAILNPLSACLLYGIILLQYALYYRNTCEIEKAQAKTD